MKLRITFLSIFFVPAILQSQSDSTYFYPDGIYNNLEEFLHKQPGDISHVRKLNLNVPTTKAFTDTLVNDVWFLDHNNDQLKKIFAVVYKGEIYFQEYGIQMNIMEGYDHRSISKSPTLHRVQTRGRYYYTEAKYPYENPGPMLAMGAMFGAVGLLAGSEMSKNQTLTAPLVYDSELKKFFVFVFKSKLKDFINSYYPKHPIPADESRLDTQTVRALFEDLNNSQ
jgi:hypothetical protein